MSDFMTKIYLDFGADKKLEGTEYQEEIAKISHRAEKDGIKLINIPIRHLGTEKSHEVYGRLEKYLEDNGIEMMFETSVKDLIVENGEIKGVKIIPSKYLENLEEETFDKEENLLADKVVLAVGRKGANWLVDMCNKHGIKTDTGIVDIGVRYELPDEVMKDVNKYMYEAKFVGRVGPFRDKVRTFCQNPSGFVASEVYDNNLSLVNGHSYKERKSTNTNLAILVSHHFTHPFDKPIGYGRNVAQNLNDLGAGNIVVQRLGDIYRGKRTWDYEYTNLAEIPSIKDKAAEWFHSKWGVPKEAYLECMDAFLNGETDYGWYLCLDNNKIIAGMGVIENDFHDRKDLTPNVCAVYTEEKYRCQGIAGKLLNMVVEDCRQKGISSVIRAAITVGLARCALIVVR